MKFSTTQWIFIVSVVANIILSVVLFQGCNKKIVIDTSKGDSIQLAAKHSDSIYLAERDSTNKVIAILKEKDTFWTDKYSAAQAKTGAQSNKIIELISEVNRLKSQGTDSLQNAIDNLIDQQISLIADLNYQKTITDSVMGAKDELASSLIAALSQATDQVGEVVAERDALYLEFQAQAKTQSALVKKNKLNNLWAKVATVGLAIASIIAFAK